MDSKNNLKKYPGTLSEISPGKIIAREEPGDLDNFFLVLSLIYNDLKGLISFDVLIRGVYETPIDPKPNVHSGEYSGIRLHIERLLIGMTSEFFVFLKNNLKTIRTISFQLLLKSLDQKDKNSWNELIEVIDESSGKESFFRKMARIRSDIVFHYNFSGDELVKGFKNKFYKQEPNESNKKAFYSIGNTMESTRFFYADAAIEGYLVEHLKLSPTEKENYLNELMNNVSKMNVVICKLIQIYLNKKNGKK